ncbi:DNA polymerase alpha catalytic subunit [Orbilia oligospora]|uniref:DNA polymerase n=1 Tax=Orbilia oligospora TaxID=2813651 RepID=A0A6G1LUU0_ORBOL|nr:DNA polymerase alpha catalytic subunit [Orbilia oligospora]KAF3200962.1 DNA polymerase alpha catalytic subunit [Orbilia oligospora]KAF3233755.1 DNA-directed DNA polymerase alpha catalytic subunit pol1 [Orbilia oligospora]
MSAKASQRAKLEELRKLRGSKQTRLSSYKTQDEQRLFDELDEIEYRKVQRSRLDQDDFVVDDNGEGYVENGLDEWDMGCGRGDHISSSDENDNPVRPSTKGKRKRENESVTRKDQDGSINKYFTSMAAQGAMKHKAESTVEDKEFLSELLGQMDESRDSFRIVKKLKAQDPEPTNRRQRALSPSRSTARGLRAPEHKRLTSGHADFVPSSPPRHGVILDDNEDDDHTRTFDDGTTRQATVFITPYEDTSKLRISVKTEPTEPEAHAYNENDDDDELAVRPILTFSKTKDSPINLNSIRPDRSAKKNTIPEKLPTPMEDIDANQWRAVDAKLSHNHVADQPLLGKVASKDVTNDDGSLRFFWMDYTEIGGCLCLFGKVSVKGTDKHASAFVKINGIMRKLFFLPRVAKRSTGEEVEMSDVYSEVDELLTRLKISQGSDWKAKPCSRKYAFELNDIPKKSDYLKVLYPYDRPQVPPGTNGDSFSHVFGTGTSIFEQFVLARNIMGPCWLHIEDPIFTGIENASWCKVELQVSSPNLISCAGDSENDIAPPLKLMSLAIRTKIGHNDNKPEIISITGRVYDNVALDETRPVDELPWSCFTICRPVGQSFPVGFQSAISGQQTIIKPEKTEAGLLSLFLAKLQSTDPDIFIGHGLEENIYGTLIHRMKECKVLNWHRIGRMRRNQWPNNLGRGGYFAEKQIVSGRLMCDLSNDLGKSLMNRCQSWSLTEICNVILGERRTELDNEESLKTYAASGSGFLDYLGHAKTDTYMIAAVALRIQMIPLAKQLTNLAGNSLARTLSGTRAERNEYILLHEFTKNKYICPDKSYDKRNSQKATDEDGADEEEDTRPDGKKKDKFKGGLVLEPERGLYDKFVLVMDFNSLYPSIIQEFNICFTTVERSDLPEDQVPEIPSEQAQGILPKLISTLVQRRRQVKGLMKDKRATPAQLAQWDIKQQALKLTANSMYGCLGYVRSRFYARPLAMLTTFQGREILRSTKELAESSQLRVIYGDTDSVMINTNVDIYADAIKIGNDFKKAVNDRYRLLEIDIDNVFQRLLLHSKKKYAALNFSADGKPVVEVKGLDMKRREYCQISKDVSSWILKKILSGEDPDAVIEEIHEYLRGIAQNMRENSIPFSRYTIYTKLSKDPEQYPGGKAMPQVQVALRRRSKGDVVKANDVIAYIITGDGGNTSSPAERAFTPQELKSDPTLKPDPEWYLLKQIFPPVERLCGPIDGTDAIRLAECLGLDTRKYQIASTTAQTESEIHPLESTLSDEERFRNTKPLVLTCLLCKTTLSFGGLDSDLEICTPDGLKCPNIGCNNIFTTPVLIAQVESNIRNWTSQYYESWLACEDSSCGNRTRQVCVYGKRCIGPQGLGIGCEGPVVYEYSDKMLYNQLLYYSTLFDVERAKLKAAVENRESIAILAERYRANFSMVSRVISLYQRKCGRSWVQMDSIFSLI